MADEETPAEQSPEEDQGLAGAPGAKPMGEEQPPEQTEARPGAKPMGATPDAKPMGEEQPPEQTEARPDAKPMG